MSKRKWAEWLHREYENAAQEEGWDTQEGTSVPFDELPEENRETMLRVGEELDKRFSDVELKEWPKRTRQRMKCPFCNHGLPVVERTECDRCGAHLRLTIEAIAPPVGEGYE